MFSGKEDTPEEREQKRQENDFDVLKYDGIQALQIGRYAYAIACFTHALDIKEDRETREHLAGAYIHNNDLESACDVFEQLSNLYREEPGYVVNRAKLLYELEEYPEAITLCKELLETDDSLAYPSFLLGQIYKAQGKLEDAEKHCSDSISKQESFVDALLLRSEIRYDKKDYEGSLTDIDAILSLNYDAEEVLLQKGMVLEAMDNISEALSYYNNVLEQNPFIPDAYAKLARLHIKSGEYSEADDIIHDGIEQNGESSLLISVRAELKEANGDAEGAEEDRQLAEQLKMDEEEMEDEDYDVEREMKERMSAVNPFQ